MGGHRVLETTGDGSFQRNPPTAPLGPPLSWTPFYTLDVTVGSLSVQHHFPQNHLHVRDRGFDILKLLGLVLWSKVGQKQSTLTSCDTCLIVFLQPDQGFSEGGPHLSVTGHHQLFQQ